MINSLFIKNFQSHKESELEFDKGVNVIIGSSDSGKTAIIRALRWAMFNKPSGDEFRSYWGGDTMVHVLMGNNKIIRGKSEKENAYTINNVLLKAFGQGVPDEIQKAFNINEVNIQGQLDSPFLIADSPGEVAQHFNKVANLELIDSSIKKVSSKLKSLETDLEVSKRQATAISTKLDSFIDLNQLEKDIKELEVFEQEVQANENSLKILNSTIKQIKELQYILGEYDTLLSLEKEVGFVLNAIEKEKTKRKEYETLTELIQKITLNGKKIKTYNILTNLESMVNSTIEAHKQKESKEKAQKDIVDLVLKIKMWENVHKNCEVQIAQFEKTYKEKYPDICPFCGSKVKKINL